MGGARSAEAGVEDGAAPNAFVARDLLNGVIRSGELAGGSCVWFAAGELAGCVSI